MKRLQVPFTVDAPDVDEDVFKQAEGNPLDVVQELARQKATSVFERNQNGVVIGCDQAACIDNRMLDKPGNAANAIAQLKQLRGREHRLITAVAIAHSGGLVEFADTTRLVMRDLTDGEIERYINTEQPFDCAGSYKIEGLGITLFERVDGRDHTAIMGLPMMQLSSELRDIGVLLP